MQVLQVLPSQCILQYGLSIRHGLPLLGRSAVHLLLMCLAPGQGHKSPTHQQVLLLPC